MVGWHHGLDGHEFEQAPEVGDAALRLFIAVAPLVAEHKLLSVGFSRCSTWRVGSSRTRDGTHVLCIGRQALNRWAIREDPPIFLSS